MATCYNKRESVQDTLTNELMGASHMRHRHPSDLSAMPGRPSFGGLYSTTSRNTGRCLNGVMDDGEFGTAPVGAPETPSTR